MNGSDEMVKENEADKTDAVDDGGDPGRYYEMHQPVELQCARAR
jgi:hypothetical protein